MEHLHARRSDLRRVKTWKEMFPRDLPSRARADFQERASPEFLWGTPLAQTRAELVKGWLTVHEEDTPYWIKGDM